MRISHLIFMVFFLAGVAFAAPRQMVLPSEFDAQVTRVVDGDTFRFKASMLNVDINETCRMSEYNAPEIHGKEKPEGLKAKAKMIELINGKRIHIKTTKRDKYGRWLCTATTGTISVGENMREFLKDYPGRDKYLKHTVPTTDGKAR